MKTFDNQKTIEKELTAWLNNSPESNHHYDYERWFNCIYKSFLTNIVTGKQIGRAHV